MPEYDSTLRYAHVQNFPGYLVGTDGSVWYAWRTCRSGRILTDRWKLMKQGIHKKGYRYVNLTPPEGGKYTTFRVHRLVLAVFVGPCPEGMEGCHLDDYKGDNSIGNLTWGTQERNREDARKNGKYQKGESHSQKKTSESAVREIRNRHSAGGILLRELAIEFDLSVPCVHSIIHRKTWKHIA